MASSEDDSQLCGDQLAREF